MRVIAGLLGPVLLLGCVHPGGDLAGGRDGDFLSADEFLMRFSQRPNDAVRHNPEKRDVAGNLVDEPASQFALGEISSSSFLLRRDQVRSRLCQRESDGRRFCLGSDEPGIRREGAAGNLENFLGQTAEEFNLRSMDEKGLRQGTVAVAPWSGSAWPLADGSIGFRQRPDVLSPAEKYDLLVEDSESSLTREIGSERELARAQERSLTSHQRSEMREDLNLGWARAALAMTRPGSSISVKAGRHTVDFTPAELKALAMFLWNKATVDHRFLGGRCPVLKPRTDGLGRVLPSDCPGLSPALWHLALVNHVGVSARSLVMDAAYDAEIWNQPVVGYRYGYFHPGSLKPVQTLTLALQTTQGWRGDLFKKERHPEAVRVAGIVMEVTYVVRTPISEFSSDDRETDGLRKVIYHYDLEMNSEGKVVGGQWYNGAPPDFLWILEDKAAAASPLDALISHKRWSPGLALDESLKSAARKSSSRGFPLASIVNPLFHASGREKVQSERRTNWAGTTYFPGGMPFPVQEFSEQTAVGISLSPTSQPLKEGRVEIALDFPRHADLRVLLRRGKADDAAAPTVVLIERGAWHGQGPLRRVVQLEPRALEELSRSDATDWQLLLQTEGKGLGGLVNRFALEVR